MICAWNEFLAILPPHLRQEVDRLGKEQGRELRLRLGRPPSLRLADAMVTIGRPTISEDLSFVVNTACRYSPWTAESAASGYITAPGGHRIGICGEAIQQQGRMAGFRSLRSLNIRIARDFPGIAAPLKHLRGNILIMGSPGSGKTTLLRDLIKQRSARETVAVVDERGELFPQGISESAAADVITGCSKSQGIDAVLRTMGPDTIAVDEITAAEDCDALLQACWCGVEVLATLHGRDASDLAGRAVYKPILVSKLFQNLVILRKDQSFRIERMVE